MSRYDSETTFGWSYPVGSWLNEIVGGWKYHAVVDKVTPRVPLEFAKIWRIAQARTGEAGEVRDDRRRPRRDRAHGQDGRLRAGQAGPDVGHRDDPERRAARAPGGGLQGDPDRGARDPQLGRVRRARGVPRLPGRPVQPHGRRDRRRRALDPHLLGQPRRAALLRPAHLLRAVGRHLPEPPQGRRLDDRVQGERPQPAAGLRAVQGQPAEEGRGRHDQPPPPPGRHARGRRDGHPHARSSTSTPRSSCSRRTAASGDRASRARSRCTRLRRSRRARTSFVGSSAARRGPVRAADPAAQVDVPAREAEPVGA